MIQISENLTKRIQQSVRRLYQEYSIPRWIVFALDNLAVFIVFLFAYLLRFNFVITDFSIYHAFQQALYTVSIYALFSLLLRSYSGLIRHTTVMDMLTVFISTSSSFIVLMVISLASRRILWNEILILIIHYVSITVLLFFVRIGIKIIYHFMTSSFSQKKRVLIFGAGEMGVIVKRVIQSDIKCNFQIAGFLDDNKRLQGKKLNGIPVFNPKLLIPSFIQKNNIDALIFAIKEISPGKKSSMLHLALDLGLEVLETPSVDTWLNGQFHANQIQKVKLEDLLGRDPIILNMKGIGSGLTGKTILVTGAAGSIGSEIVRQLTRFNIRKLILIDQAETPMFHLGNELKSKYSQCFVEMILADVTQPTIIERIFQDHYPDLVFHAAAYKHVPLMEENPHEAIRINVGGTKLMTMLSMKYGVKKFVMISTDKAVNPTNVMGVSKRICEMIVQSKAQKAGNATQFIITRFGNVLGSNGSVIPIFRRQIEEGGPVTVTHPEITRYFMTIPEACQLVLEAGFMGKGGEIFVFDMGKPMRITDLASQMIRLSGLTPGKDIKIKYTGLRPGEKLFEELLSDKEITKPTHHPKIKIAQTEKLDKTEMLNKIEDLLSSLYSLSKQEVVDYCRDLVLEYKSNNRKYIEQPEIIKIAEAEDKTVVDLISHPSKIIIDKPAEKSFRTEIRKS
jgi:FlaA1/EpsC-like NDP-sugar epimerase